MSTLKCKSCGLVNPYNTTACKRCGASLVPPVEAAAVTPPAEASEATKEPEPVTAWGCIQLLIVLIIAGSITGYLGMYIMEWLPSGLYSMRLLIVIFLPAAVVGLAAGLGVLWFIILFIPGALSKGNPGPANQKPDVMATQSLTPSND